MDDCASYAIIADEPVMPTSELPSHLTVHAHQIETGSGYKATVGDGSYANFNFTVLDVCPVHIGNNVFIANNVSIVTAIHPLVAEERVFKFDEVKGYSHDLEYGKPVTIEDNVWIGANVSIGPGVTIGKNSVIGMGSNVVKSIPEGVLAFGNPCRVVRKITEEDSVKYKKELF